jgi:TadE-like protein
VKRDGVLQQRRPRTGQSLVEFALVLPIMLVLFVGLADFGRIFANAILIESSARNGAELAANEYLANPPSPLNAPSTGSAAYYDNLHTLAARAVCTETRELPNSQYDTATTDCPGMPLIKVCIHDNVDPSCGSEAFSATIPAECNEMTGAMLNSQGSTSERWVEVRVCYRFSSLIDVPLISLGQFWLQRTRTFVIPCYFAMKAEPCG